MCIAALRERAKGLEREDSQFVIDDDEVEEGSVATEGEAQHDEEIND